MTTIQGYGRSIGGLVAAHLAMTLVVCGGLVLLVPTTAPATGATMAVIAPALDCAASADRARDPRFADDAGVDVPDSCDDDDDDDDAPTGSDAAVAVDRCRTITCGDVVEVVHVEVEPWISRTVDGHSLRGPPADQQNSSDADDDLDGDDDDPTAEESDLLPPTTSHQTCPLAAVAVISASAVRFSDSPLRAPPL